MNQELQWDTVENRTVSLKTLHTQLESYYRERRFWYQNRIPKKRILAKVIRYASILLVGAGTILQLFAITGTTPVMSHHAMAVFVLAATLIGFDRLTGASTGWVRYHITQQALEQTFLQFQWAWMKEFTRWTQGAEPFNPDSVFDFCMKWQARFAEIVDVETTQWADGFTKALEELEASRLQAKLSH